MCIFSCIHSLLIKIILNKEEVKGPCDKLYIDNSAISYNILELTETTDQFQKHMTPLDDVTFALTLVNSTNIFY